MSEDRFGVAYAHTAEWEGGVVNIKGDRGGKTAYGISSKYHPEMFENGIPSKDDAYDFFYREYFLKNKCDKFDHMAFITWLFDLAVNSGRTGIKQFQLAINDCIRSIPIKTEEIKADGIIGSKTISATKKFKSKLRMNVFNSLILKRRTVFYKRLARSKNQDKFLKGWLNRAQACYDYCEDFVEHHNYRPHSFKK